MERDELKRNTKEWRKKAILLYSQMGGFLFFVIRKREADEKGVATPFRMDV